MTSLQWAEGVTASLDETCLDIIPNNIHHAAAKHLEYLICLSFVIDKEFYTRKGYGRLPLW